MTTNKPLRYTLTTLFCIGAIALIGILSFSGMLYLTNAIAAALVSAAFAMIIEGEIYKQNILGGVDIALHFGKFIEIDSYKNLLKKCAQKQHLTQNCPTMAEYHKLQKRLSKLQSHWVLSKEQREKLAQTQNRLAEIESGFYRFLNNQLDMSNQADIEFNEDFNTVFPQKSPVLQSLQTKIKRKRILLWISMPVTVLGGAMAMFVTASELTAALAVFGISATTTVMCAVVWPLAVVAAIGYMLMIYKTFVDIIHHKTIQKHWQSFKNSYNEGNTMTKVLYTTGMVLLIGLAITATIATAGTWWSAAQTGIALIPFISTTSSAVKNVITTVGIGLLGISHLIFDYANSLESMETITASPSLSAVPIDQRAHVKAKSPTHRYVNILYHKLNKSFSNWCAKPLYVRCNPFIWINNIIELPFRLLLILGHLISIGVTGDRLGNINPAITATIGAAQEGVTDFHYVFGHDDDHCEGDHHHAHPNHQHSDIAGICLNIILAPTKLLAAAWNSIGNVIAGKKERSYWHFVKSEFGHHEKASHHKRKAPDSAHKLAKHKKVRRQNEKYTRLDEQSEAPQHHKQVDHTQKGDVNLGAVNPIQDNAGQHSQSDSNNPNRFYSKKPTRMQSVSEGIEKHDDTDLPTYDYMTTFDLY